MISTIAVFSFFASTALAQSATSSANPLIPTGISQPCQAYLQKLDSDSAVGACTKALISATAGYGPGGNSTGTPSTSAITNVLNVLCSSATDSVCPESAIRASLTDFASSCGPELTSSSNDANAKVVKERYDSAYALVPMRKAMCAKGDDTKWCLPQTSKSKAGASGQNAAVVAGALDISEVKANLAITSSLTRRAETAISPNMTTFSDSAIPFLFLKTVNADDCNACTRAILTAYVQFESNIPYAPGLAQSTLLNGQTALYQSVTNTCGANFLSGAVQAAGGISDGASDAAPRSVGLNANTLVAIALGVAAIGVASFH